MSDTITKTLTVSNTTTETVAHSAKAASILTDSNGRMWDFSNPIYHWIEQDAVPGQTATSQENHIPIAFATVQAAWLATRS